MAITDNNIMLEIGAVMLVAFIGAALANRGKQSVILGYMVAGILIGPFIHFDLGFFRYDGLIQDTSLISQLSELGITLLMFFVGLEFSVSKLKRVETPAIILSIINVGVNLFTGILLGTALGWPLIDTIFLASVVAMSCAAVAMKTLMELKRLSNPETEFLLGVMIVEDFISAIFLTLVGGLVVKTGGSSTLTGFLIGTLVFLAFFIILALVVIPRTMSLLAKMKNDEMFVLFALGTVCLSAALASVCGVPGLIGAFFIGMVFAETKITERMEEKMAPFRDAFVAIFFVSFGMLIDPAMFPVVIGIVAVAIVLVILDDVIITAVMSYFMGFSGRASTAISTSLCARGAESILYASVGSRAANATKGAELYPMAGAFTFVMSGVCPVFMRYSNKLADWSSRRAPQFMKYSASVISRTLSKLIMPGGFKLYGGSKKMVAAFVAYIASIIILILTEGEIHTIAFVASAVISVIVWVIVLFVLRPIVRQINYMNLGTISGHENYISRYVASLVFITMFTATTISFLFSIYWQSVLILLLAFFLWFVFLMKVTYDHTCDTSRYSRAPKQDRAIGAPPAPAAVEKPEKSQFNYRHRWKGF